MLARLSLVLGLLLGILTLAKCDDTHNSTNLAASTLYIPDLNATFSVNLPIDSDDLNFFISAPTWTSWFGVGFGVAMTNSLMLVVYSAADNQHVTVSPRLGTGDSEPPFYPSARISLGEGSSIQNGFFVVSGTCRGCRSWTTGALNLSSTVQPFILAVGPGIDLASDDPSVRLRRHSAYGHFTMNMVQATGIGSAGALATINLTATTGANMAGDIKADQLHGPLAHGVLLALAALIIAPLDMVVAGALRTWPILHILSSSTLVIFIVAAIGVGISLSHQYVETQRFATPHQILGFIVLGFMLVMLLLGIFRRVVAKSAAKQGQEPLERTGLFTDIHVWAGRILWILLLVNNGLGLQFSFAQKFLIIGYSVLAAGLFIMMILIELTIFYCCTRKRKSTQEEEEADHQLAQFYGSH